MNEHAEPLRPVGKGRYPRAQGGWCDFRPAMTMTGVADPRDPTPRAIYPRAESVTPETWVPVRS